ncbi:MAG: hypothetical protein WAO19_06500 [Candidatus Kryptoniota bacterium]
MEHDTYVVANYNRSSILANKMVPITLSPVADGISTAYLSTTNVAVIEEGARPEAKN